jgi:DNA repair protein RadC
MKAGLPLESLIRTGVKGVNAVEMGRRLLQRFGSLAALVRVAVPALLDELAIEAGGV